MRNGEDEVEDDNDDEHLHDASVLLSPAHRRCTVVLVHVVLFQPPYADGVEIADDEERDHPAEACPTHQVDLVALIRDAKILSPCQRKFHTCSENP